MTMLQGSLKTLLGYANIDIENHYQSHSSKDGVTYHAVTLYYYDGCRLFFCYEICII